MTQKEHFCFRSVWTVEILLGYGNRGNFKLLGVFFERLPNEANGFKNHHAINVIQFCILNISSVMQETICFEQVRRNRGVRGLWLPTFPSFSDHRSSLILLELHNIPKYHYSSLLAVFPIDVFITHSTLGFFNSVLA